MEIQEFLGGNLNWPDNCVKVTGLGSLSKSGLRYMFNKGIAYDFQHWFTIALISVLIVAAGVTLARNLTSPASANLASAQPRAF